MEKNKTVTNLRYHDKPLELIREFGKVNDYKVNMQKSTVYISNKQTMKF